MPRHMPIAIGLFIAGLVILANVRPAAAAESADPMIATLGQALFERVWVSAPASTEATDGLGPLFNARACASCHDKAGRGTFTIDAAGLVQGRGLLLRLGREDGSGDPVYGRQLQTGGIQGQAAEGRLMASIQTQQDALTRPLFRIEKPAFGPLDEATRSGGRLAPSLRGLGLLGAVPDQAILEAADPTDRDRDGISGRPNLITRANGEPRLGRFGWKAAEPNLLSQSAGAFASDIGLSSPLRPRHSGDCTDSQIACIEAPSGATARFDNSEVSQEMLELVVGYLASLSPPRPARLDLPGQGVFEAVGCASCHRPVLPLPDGHSVAAYSDLLLHDMGAGLADGIGESAASGQEWRTAPLWGLGLLLAKEMPLLHDARAKDATEAVLWHGGEAQNSKDAFLRLSSEDKAALLRFLSNL